MELSKVDAFVVVSVDDEMPHNQRKISVSMDGGKTFPYETVNKHWKKEEVSFTHWLKPIEQVYVLTEAQLREAITGYATSPLPVGNYIQSISKQ
jgi:hypothetical protein